MRQELLSRKFKNLPVVTVSILAKESFGWQLRECTVRLRKWVGRWDRQSQSEKSPHWPSLRRIQLLLNPIAWDSELHSCLLCFPAALGYWMPLWALLLR